MFFALAQIVNRAERSFAHHVAHAFVFWCEAQFFRVHQFAIARPADGDHLVRLFQREAQRLLEDDVLAGSGRGDRRARVQMIGKTDVRDVVVCARQRRVEIHGPLRDLVLLSERLRMGVASRIDADDLGVGNESPVTLGMNVGDESSADQQDSRLFHEWAAQSRCSNARV